jgi:nucleoid-associated protein YgaU
MQRDFKMGMALGLLLVTVVVVWLSTRPSLSVKARMLKPSYKIPRKVATALNSQNGSSIKENPIEQLPFVPPSSNIPPAETTVAIQVEQGQISELIVNKQTENIKTQTFHVVREGETLSDISYRYYGSAGKWQKILDANRGVIKDENRLKPGIKLIIPE